MSSFKTKEALIAHLSSCIDEYIDYEVSRKKRKRRSVAQQSSPPQDTDEEEILDDNCYAIIKNGKRCSKKRSDDPTHDKYLCKVHNREKYRTTVERAPKKYKVNATIDANNTTPDVDSETSSSDHIEVTLSIDKDGDHVDQDGNIWDLENQIIIGKKDRKTKEKVFFKKI